MASIKEKKSKDGRICYAITSSPAIGERYYMTWHAPEGWSQVRIRRELNKVAAQFDADCRSGKIQNRKQKKEAEASAKKSMQTFREYTEKVFFPLSDYLKDTTREKYERNLRVHIYPYIGDMIMSEITSVDLTLMTNDWMKKGFMCSSRITFYGVVSVIFNHAFQNYAIPQNPMDRVPRPKETPKDKITKNNKPMRLTVEQTETLMRIISEKGTKWQLMIYLLLDTGMRRGEACGLKWKNVDLKNNKILICNNLVHTDKNGTHDSSPKSGRTREVIISPDVTMLFTKWKREQVERFGVVAAYKDSYVFTRTYDLEPMETHTVTRELSRLKNAVGISRLGPHLLRHTHASIAYTHGTDIITLADNLGHANPTTTMKFYGHTDEESKKNAGNIVRDVLGLAKA
ncbi:MAG: site-specific integrase [Lachnospiraceae bacterium]|nr:site-specific integrase [Lachnospiraceae bacterium]